MTGLIEPPHMKGDQLDDLRNFFYRKFIVQRIEDDMLIGQYEFVPRA